MLAQPFGEFGLKRFALLTRNVTLNVFLYARTESSLSETSVEHVRNLCLERSFEFGFIVASDVSSDAYACNHAALLLGS